MKKIFVPTSSAYYVTEYTDRRYFSGVDLDEGILIICDTPTYFIDARYFYAVKEKVKNNGITPVLFTGNEDVKEFIVKNQIKTLLVDYKKITVFEYNRLQSEYGVSLIDCASEIEKTRLFKSEDELNKIQKACDITQKAFYEMLKSVKLGMTELELKEILEKLMISYGAEKPSFETIVAFGANGAVPHHKTGNTTLTLNTSILIDTGCVYDGYCSDYTRTFFYGEPTKEFIECYEQVKVANELAEQNITEGMTGREADAISRDYFKQNNTDKFFTHSLGHGVGVEIHELPRLTPKSNEVLANGMVVTVEPGLYYDGKLGVRIEDTVVIENGKVKRLFSDDKNLIILK